MGRGGGGQQSQFIGDKAAWAVNRLDISTITMNLTDRLTFRESPSPSAPSYSPVSVVRR